MSLSITLLRELIAYSPKTGTLTWRRRGRHLFKSDRDQKIWNTRYAGKPALTCSHGRGYLCGGILGKMYLAHRVAWAIHYGKWPTHQIDHADHVRTNNKIRNLGGATNAGNAKNLPLRKSNSSGCHGVSRRRVVRSKCPWIAVITVGGRPSHIGVYETREKAIAARKAAERRHGYHKNHGASNAGF